MFYCRWEGRLNFNPIILEGLRELLEWKPLGQLQPVDEELEELEQMLYNKAPVVLKLRTVLV